MCIRDSHRTGHLHEEAQAISNAETLRLAPGVDRLAVDVFQRQVGPPAFIDPGVVQPRDVRVLQQRTDLAFTRHALGQACAPRQAWQLQRHLALEAAVSARSQPDACLLYTSRCV